MQESKNQAPKNGASGTMLPALITFEQAEQEALRREAATKPPMEWPQKAQKDAKNERLFLCHRVFFVANRPWKILRGATRITNHDDFLHDLSFPA